MKERFALLVAKGIVGVFVLLPPLALFGCATALLVSLSFALPLPETLVGFLRPGWLWNLMEAHPVVTTLLGLLIVTEGVFFLFFLREKRRFQTLRQPPELNKEERWSLFHAALAYLMEEEQTKELGQPTTNQPTTNGEMSEDMKKRREEFFRGWFGEAKTSELRRENVREWIAWSFFHCSPHQLQVWEDENKHRIPQTRTDVGSPSSSSSSSTSTPALEERAGWRAEVEEMISLGERSTGISFPPGKNENVKCLTISMDPVNAWHRPLIVYLGVYVMNLSAYVILRHKLGFQYHSLPDTTLGYWHRKASSATSHEKQRQSSDGGERPPVVFFHGIGVGYLPYIRLISQVIQQVDDELLHHHSLCRRDIFLFELPHISLQMVDHVPSREQTLNAFDVMLERHGHQQSRLVLIGHSFGTILCGWILKREQTRLQCHSTAQTAGDNSSLKNSSEEDKGAHRRRPTPQDQAAVGAAGARLQSRIERVVMVEPVCLLLIRSEVAYNFVYRRPGNMPMDLLTWYFVKTEIYLLHCLQRNFWWFENQLYARDLPPGTQVVLSSHDTITPSHEVRKHLLINKRSAHWLKGLDHAELLLYPHITAFVASLCLSPPSSSVVLFKDGRMQRGEGKSHTAAHHESEAHEHQW